MVKKETVKIKLYNHCLEFADKQHQNISRIIAASKKALFSETKSSAGDKHETGRAMLQLEMEKASQQLAAVQLMKEVLKKINENYISEVACLGSLIVTDKANYYLAISAGKVEIEGKNYFAVSTSSPIGMQLLGKKAGEVIPFNKAAILMVR